jgi:hypothetical protein
MISSAIRFVDARRSRAVPRIVSTRTASSMIREPTPNRDASSSSEPTISPTGHPAAMKCSSRVTATRQLALARSTSS